MRLAPILKNKDVKFLTWIRRQRHVWKLKTAQLYTKLLSTSIFSSCSRVTQRRLLYSTFLARHGTTWRCCWSQGYAAKAPRSPQPQGCDILASSPKFEWRHCLHPQEESWVVSWHGFWHVLVVSARNVGRDKTEGISLHGRDNGVNGNLSDSLLMAHQWFLGELRGWFFSERELDHFTGGMFSSDVDRK